MPRNNNHSNYKIMIRLEPQDVHYIIYGIPELEGCECYHWGENLYLVEDKDEGRYLVNVESEKVRKISEPGKLVGFSDDEIDLEAIEKLPHSYNARLRLIEYGGISRWDDCSAGLFILMVVILLMRMVLVWRIIRRWLCIV